MDDGEHNTVAVVFFTLTDRASTIPSNKRYSMVANPVVVRGLLDRKRSEEHLLILIQGSNESMKTKTKEKRQKERNNNTKHMPEKKR